MLPRGVHEKDHALFPVRFDAGKTGPPLPTFSATVLPGELRQRLTGPRSWRPWRSFNCFSPGTSPRSSAASPAILVEPARRSTSLFASRQALFSSLRPRRRCNPPGCGFRLAKLAFSSRRSLFCQCLGSCRVTSCAEVRAEIQVLSQSHARVVFPPRLVCDPGLPIRDRWVSSREGPLSGRSPPPGLVNACQRRLQPGIRGISIVFSAPAPQVRLQRVAALLSKLP